MSCGTGKQEIPTACKNQYYAVVDLRSEGNAAPLSILKPSLDAIPGSAYTVVIYTHILSNMRERHMDYITVRQTAEKWGISERRVQKLCADGRIEGVGRPGRDWLIPKDARKPADPRKARRKRGESYHINRKRSAGDSK